MLFITRDLCRHARRNNFPAELVPIISVATSLASIIVTSFSAMLAQKKRNAVDWVIFRQWSVLVIAGGFCSGFIAQYIPAIILKRGIAIFLLIIAFIMLSQWLPIRQYTLRFFQRHCFSLGGHWRWQYHCACFSVFQCTNAKSYRNS